MQIFVSDLHLTDHDDGCAASDQELLRITDVLAAAPGAHTLILLGDIVDLLRSGEWGALWNEDESPWADATGTRGNHFRKFAGSKAEARAVKIARGAVARYPRFQDALRTLKRERGLRVEYVIGNHDYMAQLSEDLRSVLVDAFSVQHNPHDVFPGAYIDKPTSVYAIHGHAYDGVNWHEKPEGRWAFGDAIVIRLVNRMLDEAPAALKSKGPGISGLDAIEPVIDIPAFILWLEQMLPQADRRKLKLLWQRAVKELLALPAFRAPEYDEAAGTEKKALRWSTRLDLATFMAKHQSLIQSKRDIWRDNVEQLTSRGKAKDFRYVVLGHTHDARISLLSQATVREPRYYVNTGCWRKVVMRASRHEPGPFIATRLSTMFVVESDGAPTYKLLREWQAT